MNIMIKRFDEVEGLYIKRINGQDRYAYAMSDSEDLYDLEEWSERGGYPGSVIIFYDFENGKVYKPFEKKKNVIYGEPLDAAGQFYFLRADYDAEKVTLFRYHPETVSEAVTEWNTGEVSLYNLRVIGEDVHVISQDGEIFNCYYPEKFSFSLNPDETVILVSDDRVYIEAWTEEGWDDENDRAGEDYRFYDRIIVKDHNGNILSEETGSLNQSPDGGWWIS